MFIKRGKNYTEREKQILLGLVDKYKDILENKATNTFNIIKKNDSWVSLATEFISQAEFPRTVKQLQTAYLNMKRSTRQQVANSNMQNNIEKMVIVESDNEAGCSKNPDNFKIVDDNLIKEYKEDASADKKGVLATGGGTYKPVLSDVGAQVLAIMGEQIKPLHSKHDSAAFYYDVGPENLIAEQPIKKMCQ